MGAIAGLVLLPFMAPVWGFRFVLERLRDEAESTLYDEGRAFAELTELSMRRSAGQLSEAEYAEQEAQLLDRLSSIREYRDELQRAEIEADEYEDAVFEDEQSVDEYTLVPAESDVEEEEWS
jgi:hypothetical protein